MAVTGETLAATLDTMRYKTTLFILASSIIFAACSKSINQRAENNSIPVFDNQLLITNNGKKWGLTDLKGNEIIPFVCDGIRTISDSLGIASTYSGSYSLHTGLPRYVYCGNYFLFSKKGRIHGSEKPFSITIEGTADNHDEKFILISPFRYLPADTSANKPCNPSSFR